MSKLSDFREISGVTKTSKINNKQVTRFCFEHKITGELYFFSYEELKKMQKESK